MKIKSEITDEESITFPLLAKHICGTIVLFTSKQKGTVLGLGGLTDHQIGQHRDDWIFNNFTPLNRGTVLKLTVD